MDDGLDVDLALWLAVFLIYAAAALAFPGQALRSVLRGNVMPATSAPTAPPSPAHRHQAPAHR